MTEPPPAMEEEFNAWYDTEHLQERLAITGFRSARRWVADVAPGDGKYLATYELDAPGVSQLLGAGIYYGAALSEAQLYRGQRVLVLGGANSAGQGALFFARYAEQVTIIVRKPKLSPTMSQYLVDRISALPNVEVVDGCEISRLDGSQGVLESVSWRDRYRQDHHPAGPR